MGVGGCGGGCGGGGFVVGMGGENHILLLLLLLVSLVMCELVVDELMFLMEKGKFEEGRKDGEES